MAGIGGFFQRWLLAANCPSRKTGRDPGMTLVGPVSSRATVSGTGNIDHVQIVFLDDPVQMHVNEILSGGRTPVPQQHVLDIRQRQWMRCPSSKTR